MKRCLIMFVVVLSLIIIASRLENRNSKVPHNNEIVMENTNMKSLMAVDRKK